MKLSPSFKHTIIEIVCFLYILLFVYAAVNKLLDFDNFRIQLGQSPLLSAFAGLMAWIIPIVELIISLFLFFKSTRLIALKSGFMLMTMFTAYIFIMLHYSPFVPCSCGGVLNKLGWNEHLIFNLAYTALGLIAILLITPTVTRSSKIRTAISLTAISMPAVGIVILLFHISEHVIHKRNNFTRRFTHFPIEEKGRIDLHYNSYYFAGAAKGKIYLGNYTTPLTVTVLDTTLSLREEYHIELDQKDTPFRRPRLIVAPPYFYITDGTVPCVFKGTFRSWKGTGISIPHNFSLMKPIDSCSLAFRGRGIKNGYNILGLFRICDKSPKVELHPVLQAQRDGFFDTDGYLSYDTSRKKLIYTYRYRNQYLVSRANLTQQSMGKTIDTISIAQIEISATGKAKTKKMSKPPLIVNKAAYANNGLLYVHSALIGLHERKEMWEKASIIDVYDTNSKDYLLSFYINNVKNKPITDFIIEDGNLLVLIDRQLIIYRLGNQLRDYSLKYTWPVSGKGRKPVRE